MSIISNVKKYEGQWPIGKFHGFGRLTFARNNKNGPDYYVGIFKDVQKHGEGKMTWKNVHSYNGVREYDVRSTNRK